jgi:hypothetical protein
MFVLFFTMVFLFLVLTSCHRLEAMTHPRCVGWGEIGSIFTRQLRNAVKLGKPITIHTREAEEDTERILKEEVPKDHKVVHSSMLLRGSIIYLFFLT